MANVLSNTPPYITPTPKIMQSLQGWNNLLGKVYTYNINNPFNQPKFTFINSYVTYLNLSFLRQNSFTGYSTLTGFNLGASSNRPTIGQLFPRGYPFRNGV